MCLAARKVAEVKALRKDKKQAALARVRQLQGWQQEFAELEIYKDASGSGHAAGHVSTIYHTYL